MKNKITQYIFRLIGKHRLPHCNKFTNRPVEVGITNL